MQVLMNLQSLSSKRIDTFHKDYCSDAIQWEIRKNLMYGELFLPYEKSNNITFINVNTTAFMITQITELTRTTYQLEILPFMEIPCGICMSLLSPESIVFKPRFVMNTDTGEERLLTIDAKVKNTDQAIMEYYEIYKMIMKGSYKWAQS